MPVELLLAAPGEIELAEYEDVEPGPEQVHAQALVSSISHGTELTLFLGRSPFGGKSFDPELRLFVEAAASEYPARLGYEWVGEVTATGSSGLGVSVGERIHAALPHRETQLIDVRGLVPWSVLPADLPVERAAMLQSATIALQAVHDAELRIGDRVAVFGLGVFGLMSVELARISGASFVVAVDPIGERRAFAERLGADWTLDPAATDVGAEIKRREGARAIDVAIEFSGRYDALQQAIRSVRLAGRVVAAGFYAGAGGDLRLGEEWHHNRLTLVSSMQGWGAPSRFTGWDRPRLRAAALELLAEGRLASESFVTHRFAFASAADAYRLIAERPTEALRVLLDYDVA
jgi:2-desacetyl-2-hydroxyethyl bacteriochlorophyllide A dehydrogenase